MTVYAWLSLAIALSALGTLGIYAWLHRRDNRRRWARYDSPRGSGQQQSMLCPNCRQRIHSPRAIRERRCPSCERPF